MTNQQHLLKPPDGVTSKDFETILTSAAAAYQYRHRIPTVQEIANLSGFANKKVANIIATTEFKSAMRQRGYEFNADKAKLTAEQVWAVSIITDPTNRKPLKDKLAQAGIAYWQYKAWLAQPIFSRYVKEIGEKMLVD